MIVTEIIGTTGGTAGTALTMGPGSMIAMVGAGMMTIMTGMTATGTAMETDMETMTTPSIQTTEPAAVAQLETIMAGRGGKAVRLLIFGISMCLVLFHIVCSYYDREAYRESYGRDYSRRM